MKSKLATSILILIAAGSLAQSPSKQEQVVLDLHKKKFDWLIAKQYDSLENLLDGKVLYIHSNGWIENKSEVIADLKSGKLEYKNVTVKESSVRMYPSMAVVNGLGIFDGVTDGKPFNLELRYTEVYSLSGKKWKLVSRHSNRMP